MCTTFPYCNGRVMLAGNPSDHPDDRSDCMGLPVKKDPRARDEMGRAEPHPPLHQGWTLVLATDPLYKQPRAARKTLIDRPARQRQRRGVAPSLLTRESLGVDADQPARSRVSGQVNLLCRPVPVTRTRPTLSLYPFLVP